MKELLSGVGLLMLAVMALAIVLLLTSEDSIIRFFLAGMLLPFGLVAAVLGCWLILFGWDRWQRERRRKRR